MFGYYKPKTYRSTRGCCICKRKSSRSRFTDSKRYEEDFKNCFGLHEIRSGDVCNACLLLVKKWKKLPPGSEKNWNHVVDVRAGHSLKTLKIRSKKAKFHAPRPPSDTITNRRKKIARYFNDSHSTASSASQAYSSSCSVPSNMDTNTKARSASLRRSLSLLSCLDPTYWKKQKVCCGIIFEGLHGEVLIDVESFNPCCHKKYEIQQKEAPPSQTIEPTI